MSGEWHSNSGEELDAVHVLAQPCAAVGLVLEEVTLSAPMLAKGLDEVPPTRFMSVLNKVQHYELTSSSTWLA